MNTIKAPTDLITVDGVLWERKPPHKGLCSGESFAIKACRSFRRSCREMTKTHIILPLSGPPIGSPQSVHLQEPVDPP